MNKAELIDLIADSADISKAAANKALDALTDAIIHSVAAGKDVALVGFGTFTRSERSARAGRNPQTGQPIQIAAATLPKFKAGKAFKDAVNK